MDIQDKYKLVHYLYWYQNSRGDVSLPKHISSIIVRGEWTLFLPVSEIEIDGNEHNNLFIVVGEK